MVSIRDGKSWSLPDIDKKAVQNTQRTHEMNDASGLSHSE